MSACPKGGRHVRCTKKTCPIKGPHCARCGAELFR